MQYFSYLIVIDNRYEEGAGENCSPVQASKTFLSHA